MCLLTVAHGASERFPLIIAANRDEDYQRPTHEAHVWGDAPDVVGGTDAVAGGSWLAVTAEGRFAAVTNLRGAMPRTRSRGALVRDFVLGADAPLAYASAVAAVAHEYAGFHLVVGVADGATVYLDSLRPAPRPLPPGIHAFSNAPADEHWPKVDIAIEAMRASLATETLLDDLLRFLSTPQNAQTVEREVFIAGDRYGTRSSTVIVVSADEIVFAEQSFTRGGLRAGERRVFRTSLDRARARSKEAVWHSGTA